MGITREDIEALNDKHYKESVKKWTRVSIYITEDEAPFELLEDAPISIQDLEDLIDVFIGMVTVVNSVTVGAFVLDDEVGLIFDAYTPVGAHYWIREEPYYDFVYELRKKILIREW